MVIVCALLASGKSRVIYVRERACAITMFISWFTVTCYHTVFYWVFLVFPNFQQRRWYFKITGSASVVTCKPLKAWPRVHAAPVASSLRGRAASCAGSCSCARRAGHHLCPTEIISSRKVCNAGNEVKTLAKQDWITASIFGLLEMALRHQNARLRRWAAVFPWMGSVSVGGVGEQDVARFTLGNHLGWGQLSCVCVFLD